MDREYRDTGRTLQKSSHGSGYLLLPCSTWAILSTRPGCYGEKPVTLCRGSYNTIAFERCLKGSWRMRLPITQGWSNFQIGFIGANLPWSWSKTYCNPLETCLV